MSTPTLFVGLDLTDPFSRTPRPVDVAIVNSRGRCAFTTLPAVSIPLQLAAVDRARLSETWLSPLGVSPDGSTRLVVDGPLALAQARRSIRESERLVAAAGKTADVPPEPGSRKPYAGFVRGSLELAHALVAAGWRPFGDSTSLQAANLFEAYPGGSWSKLAGLRLPNKSTAAGRTARLTLASQNGLRFATAPATHDQLDAALCAWLGWRLAHEPSCVEVVGLPCFNDAGMLREGAILRAARRR